MLYKKVVTVVPLHLVNNFILVLGRVLSKYTQQLDRCPKHTNIALLVFYFWAHIGNWILWYGDLICLLKHILLPIKSDRIALSQIF